MISRNETRGRALHLLAILLLTLGGIGAVIALVGLFGLLVSDVLPVGRGLRALVFLLISAVLAGVGWYLLQRTTWHVGPERRA
ncbi:MAG TPA: hypothetical protein VM434_10300 [Beijerinckiaceae bacterium]|nr:hypothetical protein [Beijerinckiaceae bacterium]